MSHNKNFINIEYKNERKKTTVLFSYLGNEKVVVKSFSDESPLSIKEAFEKERLIYSYRPSCAPIMIRDDPFSITIEYIDGAALGDLAFQGKLTSSQVNKVFHSALNFYLSIVQGPKRGQYDNFRRYLRVLTYSGPAQNSDVSLKHKNRFGSKVHRALVRILGRMCEFVSVLENKFFKVDYLPGLSHSDFHYNNVIVNDNGCYFIDFERTEFSGFFVFDLLFLLVVLEDVEGHGYKCKLDPELERNMFNSLGKKMIYFTFKLAVSLNNKFKRNG